MMAQPLYYYSRKADSMPDAFVWAWTNGGRPAAIATMSCMTGGRSGRLTYEFDRLSPQPLAFAIEGGEPWAPRAGITMKTLPNVPAPAEDAAARLKQVAAILSRLKATEVVVRPRRGEPAEGDLAWLPKPVHRYSDAKQGTIDGFLCLCCLDTDPEIVMVLEAQRDGNAAPEWRGGFNRIALAELNVYLDKKEIWKAQRIKATANQDAYRSIGVNLGQAAGGGYGGGYGAYQADDAADASPAADGRDEDGLNALLRAMLQRSEDRKTRYDVPQGDVAALTKCIQRLVAFQPSEPADILQHELRFRPALVEAARAIVKLQKDRGSDAGQAAQFILLEDRVYRLARAAPAEQKRVIADVDDYLKEQLKLGNTHAATNLAETAARTLQRMGRWDDAIASFESFAAQCAGHKDAAAAEWAKTMRADAASLRTANAKAPKPAPPEVAPRGKLRPIDLSRKANRPILNDAYNGLAELPKGEQSFADVTFAVGEKMLQLEGPFHGLTKIAGIPVGRKLRRLYLLQATLDPHANGVDRPEGATAAIYKIRYADGAEESLSVIYGKDVRGWYVNDEGQPVSRGRVVWTGSNPASRRDGTMLRLYLGIWENPHPEKPVATINFTKPKQPPLAPLCVAITAEE